MFPAGPIEDAFKRVRDQVNDHAYRSSCYRAMLCRRCSLQAEPAIAAMVSLNAYGWYNADLPGNENEI